VIYAHVFARAREAYRSDRLCGVLVLSEVAVKHSDLSSV
jgi:hypothetical protein